ncbi:MAG: hypothetical protein QNJ94_18595 [Alphaproteobacteria bacterium]|nr:hypothetical protein [Alphaproteobacteria bacterium]
MTGIFNRRRGDPPRATQAEAEAGTLTALRQWSPKRIAEAIAALGQTGGVLEFVSTEAITAAATLTVTGMEAGYDYVITLESFAPASNAETLWLRFSDDDGSSYESGAGDYAWVIQAGSESRDDSDTEIELTQLLGSTAGNRSTIELTLINPNASDENTEAFWSGRFIDTTPNNRFVGGGGYFLQGTDAVSAIQFSWSGGGNFKAQGDMTVWRRKRS